MSDHKQPLQLATAAWMQLHSITQSYQAAILRGDPQDQIEALRQMAHDVLDANLDMNAKAAQAVRAILG